METILAQTVTDWELIICDSYSDDGSWEFFQKFKGDPRIRMYQVPKEGIYAGWNECLRRCTGKYIQIATSDDTAEPEFLETLLKPLERLSQLKLAFCNFRYIDEHGIELESPANFRPQRQFFAEWLDVPSIRNGQTEFLLHATVGMTWVTMGSVMFHRSLVDEIGHFRTDRGSTSDMEWGLRASLCTDFGFMPQRLVTWRIHAGQSTQKSQIDSIQYGRLLLENIESVLKDPQSRVPFAWQAVSGWKHAICEVAKMEYYDNYALYRGVAIRRPMYFFNNAVRALFQEPRLLAYQACRLFAWSGEFSPDPELIANQLIKLFHASWPPQPLGEY